MTRLQAIAAKSVDTSSLPDEQCDRMMYELYRLTEEEIAIIEGRE